MSASPSTNTVQDKAKLAVAGIIVVAAVVAFYVLANRPVVLRLGIVLAGVAIALALGWTTQIGKDFVTYCQDSLTETKKVVWPSRKETMNTTVIVLVFVAIASTFFWVLDLILAFTTKFFTGQGS